MAVSFCFLLFRLFVQILSFRKLHLDDFLITAAWAICLVVTSLCHTEVSTLYENSAVNAGEKAISLEFLHKDAVFIRRVLTAMFLFHTSLLLIKLSMLVFFRRLGSRVRSHKIWWWCILVMTIIFWIVCVADFPWSCLLRPSDPINSESEHHCYVVLTANKFKAHCYFSAATLFETHSRVANLALDVLTDCLSGFLLDGNF